MAACYGEAVNIYLFKNKQTKGTNEKTLHLKSDI